MNIEKANEAIKNAWLAGVFMGVITSVCALGRFLGLNLWSLIDAFIAFSLSFGIYKKSRICSILLFSYFIFSRIMFSIDFKPQITGMNVLWILFFGYFLFQGIRGTFVYHKLNRAKTNK